MSSSTKKARTGEKAETAKVAFLGGTFSFTYNAAQEFFGKHGIHSDDDLQSGRSVKSVFESVEKGDCEYGILPAESSTAGSIQSVNDYLLIFADKGLEIIAEHRSREKVALVAKEGQKDVDLTKVYGHSHFIDSCSDYLDLLDEKRTHAGKPPVERVVALDSSTACSLVGDNTAAIANSQAAEYYHLSILHEHIGQDLNSETRYVVIGKPTIDPLKLSIDANSPRKSRRGSVVFACNNEPGQVMKWSSCFAFRNLSILKVDSRPASVAMHLNKQANLHVRHFDILFFVDFEVLDSKTYTSCISNLQDFVSFFRPLGIYEMSSGKPLPASPNEEIMSVYY